MTQAKTEPDVRASRLERRVRSGDREFCLEAITPAEHDLISNAVDVTMERLIRVGAVDQRSSAEAWVSMIELAKRMLLEGKHSAASNA